MATGAEFFSAPRRGKLARLADRFEQAYGPGRALPGGRRKIVERAARKLALHHGDLDALDFAEKKAALELLWRDGGVFVPDENFVARWLDWADGGWRPRIAETRILIALLRHFDPERPAQAQIQAFIATRAQNIWGRLGDFARTHRLWTADAPQRMARHIAEAGAFLHDAEQSAQIRPVLLGSGFLVAVGAIFADEPAFGRVQAAKLLDFFEPAGLLSAFAPFYARQQAKIALTSRLIDESLAAPTQWPANFALMLRFIGDPRETLEDWANIPPQRLAEIEAWLAPQTIALSFDLVAALASDDEEQLARRRGFWAPYAPYATRARLIGAAKAQKLARARAAPCRALKTYLSDHCGFLAAFRGPRGEDIIVVELNNRAQSLFWPQTDPQAPDFDQSPLDGAQLRAGAAIAQSHLPPNDWPEKFAALIRDINGLAPNGAAQAPPHLPKAML